VKAKVISDKVLAKERKKKFEISRASRFRYRTHYFTDSGMIGAKEFVSSNYQRFKHLFHSNHEKKPKPIKGIWKWLNHDGESALMKPTIKIVSIF
jgi:hypothetical protein